MEEKSLYRLVEEDKEVHTRNVPENKLSKVCANTFMVICLVLVTVLLAAGTLKLTLWILGA